MPLFLCLFLTILQLHAQVSFVIDKLPQNTPANAEIYLTSSFNSWKPDDAVYKLVQDEDGKYRITLPEKFTHFEYKFTRGSWATVEGRNNGHPRANRILNNEQGEPQTIIVQIQTWEDLGSEMMDSTQLAKITFVLDKIPANTPQNDEIFITHPMNDWLPNDSSMKLKLTPDGKYTITIREAMPIFEYKFTRGNWASVEGAEQGQTRANRLFRNPNGEDQTVHIEILSWEDLEDNTAKAVSPVTFVIEEIPENTPHDAVFFIAGNFNEWNPSDSAYRLYPTQNGKYAVTLVEDLDILEYKFTRGNWYSVEGNSSGQARQNRVFHNLTEGKKTVPVKIETWEDLEPGMTPYMYMLSLAAFQGILLALALGRLQNNNRKANRLLIVLILMISFSILAKLLAIDRDVFKAFPKLILVPDLIIFLYAPVFLIYIRELLTTPSQNRTARRFLFVPFLLHLMAYVPMLMQENQVFEEDIVNRVFLPMFIVVGATGLIYNTFYWIKCNRIIRGYQSVSEEEYSFDQNVRYLVMVMNIKAICIAIWWLNYIAAIIGYFINYDMVEINNFGIDLVWVVFAFLTYFLGYYAMSQPELFKLPEKIKNSEQDSDTAEEAKPQKKEPDEMVIRYKKELEKVMIQDKPYINPKLTLAELAEMTGTNTHTLSKVINDGFEMNFYNFVNLYRIEEFKKIAQKPDYKHYTLLALALEVGFNSKTAFNRAFKKLTGYTPKQFLEAEKEGATTSNAG